MDKSIVSLIKQKFEKYFDFVDKFCNKLSFTFYYPTHIIFTEINKSIVIELIGYSESRVPLIAQTLTAKNYFFDDKILTKSTDIRYAFSGGSPFLKTAWLNLISNLTKEQIMHDYNFTEDRMKSAFPNRTTIIINSMDGSTFIPFYIDNKVFSSYQNCSTFYVSNNRTKMRHFLAIIVIENNRNYSFYNKLFDDNLNITNYNIPLGISIAVSKTDMSLANQLNSLIHVSNISEPNIQSFLEENPQLLLKSLDYKNFIPQKELVWIEGNPTENNSIIPDMFLQRNNGTLDILDFKLPLNNVNKLTKGISSRKRFIDKVEEGIAQLCNYYDYFQIDKNVLYAKENGVTLAEDTKFYLIIGNKDNYIKDEIDRIIKHRKINLILLDYDALALLFYKKSVDDHIQSIDRI